MGDNITIKEGRTNCGAKIFGTRIVDPSTKLKMLHGNGCRLHANCLTCSRNICIYDEPHPMKL